MQGNYEYQSDFARKYYGQGREEGRQEGVREGRCEEAREAIIEVLDARGLTLTVEQRERIESCADLSQLKAWHRGAVRFGSVSELFGQSAPTE
jgi:predicted transposase YdaD